MPTHTPQPLINLEAFRAAVASGVPAMVSPEQLRALLDAYEASEDAKPAVLGVVGDYVRVTLPVIVPRADLDRLERGRTPVFAYDAVEVARATEVHYQTVRRAIRQGLLAPGNLSHVLELRGRILQLAGD